MVELLLRRDRALVLAGLAAVAALACLYLLLGPAAAAEIGEGRRSPPALEAHVPVEASMAEEAEEDESLPP